MKLKAILGAFISGIMITVMRAYAYNQAINILSKSKTIICPSPDIVYIAEHSPITLYDAAELYPPIQRFNINKEEIIEYACRNISISKRYI